eukprot:m.11813 g.11813  ORF g.11813 m.11813 type:complete len:454 (+) comp3892_c0_seq1:364-1725(+)
MTTASLVRLASPPSEIDPIFTVEEDVTPTFCLREVENASLEARVDLCRDLTATQTEAFFMTDLGDIQRKHDRWMTAFPTVHPFYAVKCNSDVHILETLALLGANFDCASMKEMQTILSLGVTPDRIIFAHPCKSVTHLKYARSVGVTKMTFDNHYELEKIATHYPDAEIVLRILVDDSKARCRLGLKFGAELGICESLLSHASSLGLTVVGVSFHVGSGASDASAYSDAVARARTVFDMAAEQGHAPYLLDIGGGFPGDLPSSTPLPNTIIFEDIAEAVNGALDTFFSHVDFPYLRVIAEPGRYYVHSASSIAVNIVSKRRIDSSESTADEAIGNITTGTFNTSSSSFMYYVNDGVYGSFNCIVFDHAAPKPILLHATSSTKTFSSSVWGPTCDSVDCVCPSVSLPELDIGDWLLFHNMGAYTACAASTFNGFQLANHFYTISNDDTNTNDDL